MLYSYKLTFTLKLNTRRKFATHLPFGSIGAFGELMDLGYYNTPKISAILMRNSAKPAHQEFKTAE
jgi:hypothetical protein